jgi:hypothetical protein
MSTHRRPARALRLKPLASLIALTLPIVATPAFAMTFTVTTLTDTAAGTITPGSLRDGMLAVNNSTDPTNTIQFQAGLNGAITLVAPLPLVFNNVTIDGSAANVAIDGGSAYRIFFVGVDSASEASLHTNFPSAPLGNVLQVTLSHLTLQNGRAKGGDGGGGGMGAGGALFVNGSASVTLDTVNFVGSSAVGGTGQVGSGAGGGLGGNGGRGGGGIFGNGSTGLIGAAGGGIFGDGGYGPGGGGGYYGNGGSYASAGGAGHALAGISGSGGTGYNGGAAGGVNGGGGGAGANSFAGGGGGFGGSNSSGGGVGGKGGFGGGGGGGKAGVGGAGGFGGGGAGGTGVGGLGGFGGGGAIGGASGGFGGGGGDTGGAGGFGGGGGKSGAAGFGGGAGNGNGGGGGAAFGGAVFVADGASLQISGGPMSETGTSETGGSTNAGGAGLGFAFGSFYLQGNGTLFFSPNAGALQTVSGDIVDDQGSGISPPVGYSPGTWNWQKNGAGTLEFNGTTALRGSAAFNSGVLRNNGTMGGIGVPAGAVLSGDGTFLLAVGVSGTIVPGNAGNPVGTLTIGTFGLQYASTGLSCFHLGAASSVNSAIVSPHGAIAGGAVRLDFDALPAVGNSYTLINAGPTGMSGSMFAGFTTNNPLVDGYLDYTNPNTVAFQVTAIDGIFRNGLDVASGLNDVACAAGFSP